MVSDRPEGRTVSRLSVVADRCEAVQDAVEDPELFQIRVEVAKISSDETGPVAHAPFLRMLTGHREELRREIEPSHLVPEARKGDRMSTDAAAQVEDPAPTWDAESTEQAGDLTGLDLSAVPHLLEERQEEIRPPHEQLLRPGRWLSTRHGGTKGITSYERWPRI
jgi:hypothetical protein